MYQLRKIATFNELILPSSFDLTIWSFYKKKQQKQNKTKQKKNTKKQRTKMNVLHFL